MAARKCPKTDGDIILTFKLKIIIREKITIKSKNNYLKA